MSNQKTPEFRYAEETEVQVSQLMLPQFANLEGKVHGGEVLKLVDSLAYVCAARFSGGLCVTAAMDRVEFHEPIKLGELLTLVARIDYAGKTSLEVGIEVWAEDISSGERRLTNSCHVTMVHLEDGRPSPVPRLVCRTRESRARYIQARMRRDMIARQRREREEFLGRFESMTDDELEGLM